MGCCAGRAALGRHPGAARPPGDARRSGGGPLATPSEVGFAVRDTDGRVLAGLSDGLAVCDPDSGEWTPIWDGDHDATQVRINDGKTDHDGRVWFGTMHREEAEPAGALYTYSGGIATKRVGDITTSNGLGWSPDGTLFYYTDSMARSIWAFDTDQTGGALEPPRVRHRSGRVRARRAHGGRIRMRLGSQVERRPRRPLQPGRPRRPGARAARGEADERRVRRCRDSTPW